MNILFLITKRQTRGAETFAVQLAESLQGLGHNVLIAGLYRPTSNPVAIPNNLKWVDISQQTPSAIPRKSILRGIATLVRDHNIDLIQANASDTLKYAVLSKKLYGWSCPVVYRNASIMSAWTRAPWHHYLTQTLLHSVDAIASVSNRSKQDIEQEFNVPGERVHHLGIAVDEKLVSNRSAATLHLRGLLGAQYAADEKLIFHVGALSPEKNHVGLLETFERITRLHDGKVRLVCIGSGPLEAELREASKGLAVSWLGYRTDVPKLLPAADLLLLTSHIEGTPGVVLEAGLHRVLPLSYRVGAVDECYPTSLMEQGTVHAGQPHLLADLAVTYLADDQLRLRLAEVQRKFVLQHYSMGQVTRAFDKLYTTLLPAQHSLVPKVRAHAA